MKHIVKHLSTVHSICQIQFVLFFFGLVLFVCYSYSVLLYCKYVGAVGVCDGGGTNSVYVPLFLGVQRFRLSL